MDDIRSCESGLVQLARLALQGQMEDVRLFVARLARAHRSDNPELGRQLIGLLQSLQPRPAAGLRQTQPMDDAAPRQNAAPAFVRSLAIENNRSPAPLLDDRLTADLRRIITERHESAALSRAGLTPTRSCLFVGPPGVGKTMAAGWIALQLDLPLHVVDLATLMSGLLGGSAANLRAVMDFAKSSPCVLFIDEIDAVAKHRSDHADVGEAKRLVTVLLQELDAWPPSSLLLAATNHPELLDQAVWRRFEAVARFHLPGPAALADAVRRFLAADVASFEDWVGALAAAHSGRSPADVENTLLRMRRSFALGEGSASDLAKEALASAASNLGRASRLGLALELAEIPELSQRAVSGMTGVSRDTLRKRGGTKVGHAVRASGGRSGRKPAMAAE